MFNIVLVSPKIPQNTGTIGRTCVSIGAPLHIVRPIPFSLDEKAVRRAGLDYWPHLDLSVWEDLEAFERAHPVTPRHFMFTTKTDTPYFETPFQPGDFFYFGSEDAGLPLGLIANGNPLTIPMDPRFRSLNLSNAVSIVLYEALRQNYPLWQERLGIK